MLTDEAKETLLLAAEERLLRGLSDESLNVLDHFGAEAPAQLNEYACQVEDALLEQLEIQANIEEQARAIAHQAAEYENILYDPHRLAAYVQYFFSEEGPCPVDVASYQEQQFQAWQQHQVANAVEQQYAYAHGAAPQPGQLNSVIQNNGHFVDVQQQHQFQASHPQIAPNYGQTNQAADAEGQWNNLSAMMATNPQEAYKLIGQMSQTGALQQKVLFQDGR